MPAFAFPTSSSPPSTPDRGSNSGGRNIFGDNNPSTTPAGPPPSSAGSYTPVGPPPSSFLGSSTFTQQNKQPFSFSQQSTFNSPGPQFKSSELGGTPGGLFGRVQRPAGRSGLSQQFGDSIASQQEDYERDAEGDEDDDEGEQRYQLEDEYSDDQMNEHVGGAEYYEGAGLQSPSRFNSSGPLARSKARGMFGASGGSDLLLQSPARFERSQRNDVTEFRKSLDPPKFQRPNEPLYGKITKDFSNRMGIAELIEPGNLILESEDAINRLYTEGIGADEDGTNLKQALSVIPGELIAIWTEYEQSVPQARSDEYRAAIGPGPRAPKFLTAQFLSSLLLRLHHPAMMKSAEYEPESMSRSLRIYEHPQESTKLRQLPAMLLDWMYENHEPAPGQLNDVRAYQPSPSAHPFFWETLLNSLLRGKVYPVALTLQSAGWEHSNTSTEDARAGIDAAGYSGQALENIRTVIDVAAQTLSQCPSIMGDWNIRGSDWTLFRLRVSQALENLKIFAEGRNKTQDDIRGLSKQSLSATARKASSHVPWAIYQRLTTLYNIMLGDSLAILETSQDWCEATIGLVVWWNPSRDDTRLSQSRARNSEDSAPEAYFERIVDSFYTATQGSDFQVNTLSPAEMGLASIFEGHVAAVVTLLESCSVPIAAAVVEVASLGGWLPKAEAENLITMGSLDQNDMEVLGLAAPSIKPEDLKDDVLVGYAAELCNKGLLRYTSTKKASREGWEVSIELLGRLNSAERSEHEVESLIEDFPMDSNIVVDKLWNLLNYLGMSSQAEAIAKKYADSLADSTKNYGESLWYYALSHSPQKVKDVLDLLISYSLIHSTAWPPTSDLDLYLSKLIDSPQTELARLSKVDFEAAALLHKMLSGYATLRNFYLLRDAEIVQTEVSKIIRPKSRKIQAAQALFAVLASSDDNIRGGLYDESRGAVVSVDFLLALLGEAMPFLTTSTSEASILSTAQLYTLLKTIEDLQSVSERIYKDCEAFLQTVIASTPGLKGRGPMDLLSKSSSGLSGTDGSFSLVGSSMMASQLNKSMSANGAIGGSGTLTAGSNVKRGWDWRSGLEAGMKGEDLLRILRLNLARQLATVGLREAESGI